MKALSIGVGGIPGILSIMFEYWAVFALCMAIAIVVPFVLTMTVGKRQLAPEDRGLAAIEAKSAAPATAADPAVEPETDAVNASPQVLVAPLSGTVKPITEMPDPVFFQQVHG